MGEGVEGRLERKGEQVTKIHVIVSPTENNAKYMLYIIFGTNNTIHPTRVIDLEKLSY